MNDAPTEHKNIRAVPRSIWGFTTFIAKEIYTQRKWVLFPLWVLLAVIALLILLGGTSALIPAIYIAF